MSASLESSENPREECESEKKSVRKPVLDVATPPQLDMFGESVEAGPALSQPHQGGRQFRDPNPRNIYLGGRRLDVYLREADQADALLIRGFLRTLDYSDMIDAYSLEGRAPYAPAAMLGLILWGLIKGVNSLRGLEALARTDLGCMWVSGGITPEFSVIGRFIRRHAAVLTVDFFIELTTRAIKVTGSEGSQLAGDGTIVQAAGSRYKKLSVEAAAREAEAAAQAVEDAEAAEDLSKEAGQSADKDPAPEAATKTSRGKDLQQRKAHTQAVADEVARRAAATKAVGGNPAQTVISPTEPDSYVQKMKRGGSAPSYKPSILANSDRFILGHGVHPSSESAVVEVMLGQAEEITQAPIEWLLFDSGYFGAVTINLALAKDIDLLIPSGKTPGSPPTKPFSKENFIYDSETDSYRCPAGQSLTPVEKRKATTTTLPHIRYGGADCRSCPFWGECTEAQRGRTIKRYEHDDAKEALRQFMTDPKAQERYRKRQAWVEPVFGELRDIQGLARFRRMGLEGVQLEFGLHAMAHNLRRMLKVYGLSGTAILASLLASFRSREGLSKPFFNSMSVFPAPTVRSTGHCHPASKAIAVLA